MPTVSISSRGEYLQQTVMRSFKSFGEAFDLQETFGQFVGVLEQVTDLKYVLEDLAQRGEKLKSGEKKFVLLVMFSFFLSLTLPEFFLSNFRLSLVVCGCFSRKRLTVNFNRPCFQ